MPASRSQVYDMRKLVAAIAEAVRERVWPQLEGGAWGPVVHAAFPLAQAADAHRVMEAGTHIGKLVLTTR